MHEMSCGSRYIHIYFVKDKCYCNFIDVYTFPHNIPTDTLYPEEEAALCMTTARWSEQTGVLASTNQQRSL